MTASHAAEIIAMFTLKTETALLRHQVAAYAKPIPNVSKPAPVTNVPRTRDMNATDLAAQMESVQRARKNAHSVYPALETVWQPSLEAKDIQSAVICQTIGLRTLLRASKLVLDIAWQMKSVSLLFTEYQANIAVCIMAKAGTNILFRQI